MADAHTGRLCVEIIHSHFGSLTAKVASVLLTRGRLPLPQLVRFSELKTRTVRAAVLVLVQHNVLWHSQTEDEGEVLEFNVDDCLMRLRFGKFVWLAEQLLGNAAAEIVQMILDHGKLRPAEVFSLLSAHDSKLVSVYKQALYRLVSGYYLKPSTVLSHISPRDKRIQYEAEEKSKITGFPTSRELREAKVVAEVRLRKDEAEAEKVGLKRRAQEDPGTRSSKRKATEEDAIDENTYFRVHYDRFSVHIRNTLITNAARERFNVDAALVLQAALKITESSQLSLSEPLSPPTSIANIIVQLADQVDLSKGLVYGSKKKVVNSKCIKDYLGILSSADNPTPAGRMAAFVSCGSSKVQVEFQTIVNRLQRRVLESVAREKHGNGGVRILRLLLDAGKMDEKQISKVIMMAAKDARPLLAALAADSLVSTQEVPKSADRNPTRTFYLWYVDLPKAYSTVLGNVYKILYNISMRRRAESDVNEVRVVLEKRKRSDVSQDENLLTRLEREILKSWEIKQKRLTVLEVRVEEVLFLLRDLAVLRMKDD